MSHIKILAGKLVDACGAATSVTFLEGDSYRIRQSENEMPTGWEAFTQWPLSAILIHLMIVGIVFCFAVFPIFGKPRSGEQDTRSDFGKHIDAFGQLLARTQDVAYAQARLAHYER